MPTKVARLAEAIVKEACDRSLTLATAKSCTGGLLASLLTDVDGYAHAFERGFVVYSDRAKHEMLGVDPDAIHCHGAVSETVARAMSEGALEHAPADLALAVTGFAGRGAADEEPGLVHFAVSRRGNPTLHREEHSATSAAGRCAWSACAAVWS